VKLGRKRIRRRLERTVFVSIAAAFGRVTWTHECCKQRWFGPHSQCWNGKTYNTELLRKKKKKNVRYRRKLAADDYSRSAIVIGCYMSQRGSSFIRKETRYSFVISRTECLISSCTYLICVIDVLWDMNVHTAGLCQCYARENEIHTRYIGSELSCLSCIRCVCIRLHNTCFIMHMICLR
jgi:hypothetical protein